MVTQVNLTEIQQKALNAYREALGQRYCCNKGACPGCNAPVVRNKAKLAGVPEEELSRILQESREASRRQQSLMSAKPQAAENLEKPADPEAPKSSP